MARVEVYTTSACSYCGRAKRLLDARGVHYDEIDVELDPEVRDAVVRRSGRRTVPQVFIDGHPIGGYEELLALDAAGGLDALGTDREA